MKKILGFFFNTWVLTIIGLLALSLVIWFVGPLISIAELRPLSSELARWLLIGFIAVFVLGWKGYKVWRSQRSSEQIEKGLSAQTKTAKPGNEEVAVIENRFGEALKTLKKSKIGGQLSLSQRLSGGYLYQLPWYVFIGAPGSGKTTSLINSGLQFPLADKFGKEAIKGVGGTRNCDWWFTNDAILLDTAGRYTTQDSRAEEDSAAWQGFMDLLRKNRPRRPINGVLVTASVQDLLSQPAPERERHATAIRKRINELYSQLNVRIPIYVLVTKTDLLPGFTEYFEPYGKEDREQVLGFTFAYNNGRPLDKDVFQTTYDREFGALQKRLFDGVIERLEAERDPQRRAAVYAFPQQFAGLDSVLKEFLVQAFGPTSFDDAPWVRGVYFTSGTQEDSPIDRIMGVLARTFKVENRLLPAQKSTGRSYFITRVLRDIIFKESELAGTNLRWERRRTYINAAIFATLGVVALASILAWSYSYIRNTDYLARVDQKIPAVKKVVTSFPTTASTNVLEVLPALNELRTLAIAEPVQEKLVAPSSMKWGLFQAEKIDSAGRAAYQRLLTDGLLPRIALRLEEILRQSATRNVEISYESLKAYLVMYDTEHYSADILRDMVLADWDNNLGPEVNQVQRAELTFHLNELLNRGIVNSPRPLDKQLVESTRAQLLRMSLAQRVYSRLKRLGVGADLREFSITQAAGSTASLVFVRASGQPLTKGVPGLYSYAGYHNEFTKKVDAASAQLALEEGWVLGLNEQQRTINVRDPASVLRINTDVRRLYLEDYARIWQTFIDDIKVISQNSLQQSIQVTRVLSAPDSPMPVLLRAIVSEVTLGEKFGGDRVDKAVGQVTDVVQSARANMANLLGGSKPQPGASTQQNKIENIVDEKFSSLRAYVKAPAPGQPAMVDQSVQLLAELYQTMSATETAVRGGMAPPQTEIPNKVRAEAGRLPEPIRSMLNTLVATGVTQALGATRDNLGNALRASVTDFCGQAITGRYPFTKGSERNVTQDDFARLFSPGGLMDDFFQRSLLQYVDTSTKPWSFRQVGGGQMGDKGEGSGALLQFQRAQAIRDTLFRNGGKSPALRLDFKPLEMDASITQFILDIDGQTVKYAHGPAVPMSVTWPGTAARGQVRISLSPPTAGGTSGAVFEGPWALFRMFDKVQIESAGQPERFKAIFLIDGRKAVFEVTTSSVLNPFRMTELQSFACPGKL